MASTSKVRIECILWMLVSFFSIANGQNIPTSAQLTGSPREERFPSVEERVKIYMTNWYSPPCQNNVGDFIYFRPKNSTALAFKLGSSTSKDGYEILNHIEPDRVFYLESQRLIGCSKSQLPEDAAENNTTDFELKKQKLILKNMRYYCADAVSSLVPALAHVTSEFTLDHIQHPPLLVQFGDLLKSHVYGFLNVPHFKKVRYSATRKEVEKVTRHQCIKKKRRSLQSETKDLVHMQPIIWKLSVHRHYGFLPLVEESDTPWSLKKSMAIFRAQLTGSLQGYKRHRSDEENCLDWTRCRLVYVHSNSTLVDAKLTSTRKRMPNTLNGVELVSDNLSISKIMEYKAIVMLEGNDVSSGLKWALLSQSVVLMPRPKYSSWAMEELLVPWVHYIPLNEDATDVEEKMQWVLDHDEQAQRIAERGSLWIEDLCFHPNSALDDRLIQEEMVRRYMAHFRPMI